MFKKNIVKELRSAAGIVFTFGSIVSFVAGLMAIPAGAIIAISIIVGGIFGSYIVALLLCGLSELISEIKKMNKSLDDLFEEE